MRKDDNYEKNIRRREDEAKMTLEEVFFKWNVEHKAAVIHAGKLIGFIDENEEVKYSE